MNINIPFSVSQFRFKYFPCLKQKRTTHKIKINRKKKQRTINISTTCMCRICVSVLIDMFHFSTICLTRKCERIEWNKINNIFFFFCSVGRKNSTTLLRKEKKIKWNRSKYQIVSIFSFFFQSIRYSNMNMKKCVEL